MSVVNTKDNGPSFNGPIFIAIFRKKFYFANERFLIVFESFFVESCCKYNKKAAQDCSL